MGTSQLGSVWLPAYFRTANGKLSGRAIRFIVVALCVWLLCLIVFFLALSLDIRFRFLPSYYSCRIHCAVLYVCFFFFSYSSRACAFFISLSFFLLFSFMYLSFVHGVCLFFLVCFICARPGNRVSLLQFAAAVASAHMKKSRYFHGLTVCRDQGTPGTHKHNPPRGASASERQRGE